MLCERCHEREALVHVTSINGDSGEMTKHNYCEACATDAEGGGISPRALRSGGTSYRPGDTRTDEPE
jgi:protein-arginine kinase activator protein McsA